MDDMLPSKKVPRGAKIKELHVNPAMVRPVLAAGLLRQEGIDKETVGVFLQALGLCDVVKFADALNELTEDLPVTVTEVPE